MRLAISSQHVAPVLILAASAISTKDERLARLAASAGWASIAAWVLVYSPQIAENYKLQSGEGLSIPFVFIWLLADLTNFLGAIWSGLLSTITYLALYYIICDCIMLFQVYYYRYRRRTSPEVFAHETTPLLSTSEPKPQVSSSLDWQSIIIYLAALSVIVLFGVFGWVINDPHRRHSTPKAVPEQWDDKAQIVGWVSAILYLSSRFPQIIKNRTTKCEGLSFIFFSFALIGNITFAASILIPSQTPEHVLINMSWLVGSLGTIALDLTVLAQFIYYRKDRAQLKATGHSIVQQHVE